MISVVDKDLDQVMNSPQSGEQRLSWTGCETSIRWLSASWCSEHFNERALLLRVA